MGSFFINLLGGNMKNIVFLGDSIAEMMPYNIDRNMPRGYDIPMKSDKLPKVDAEFYTHGISNIGIGTYHKYVWPHIEKESVDCFILLLGINNILRPDCDPKEEDTLDDVFEKLKKFILEIINGGHKLLVQCLYPTNRQHINDGVLYVNAKLKQFCQENGIECLDLYETLSNENRILNPAYSEDGLHPNERGYILILGKVCEKLGLKKIEPTDDKQDIVSSRRLVLEKNRNANK